MPTQFDQTSFLYGANATFIAELYARYVKDPNSVDASWASFFAEMADDARVVLGELKQRQRRNRTGQEQRRCGARRGPGQGGRPRRRPCRRHRLDPGRHPDPRLSDARPSRRQPRSARPRAAQGPARAATRVLRLHRRRPRPADLPGQPARPRVRDLARDHRAAARDLLRLGRHRVHAHPGSRAAPVAAGAHGAGPQPDQVHGRGQAPDLRQADRGRRLRAVPRQEIHRHQALRARRRRIADSRARADHPTRRPARARGDHHRHAASRPAQRAGQHDVEAVRRDLLGVPGPFGQSRGRPRLGRRQIPSRHVVGPRARRQYGPSVADRQPLASRGGRSRGDRQGAGQAAAAQGHRAHQGHGSSDARRRRVRRPGPGRRDPGAVGAARLSHRRYHPRHRQQPDRLPSTSTATIPKRSSTCRASPSSSARSSSATS